MIKVGDTIPHTTLMEYSEVEGNGCSIGPNPVDVAKATAGKTIALFALPGAFTPTCSAKHVPGYIEHHDALLAAGVREVRQRLCEVATGLTLDLTGKGLGLRSNRYSMLVKDGKVLTLNVEGPGKFEVSDAGTMLSQVKH